MEGKKGKGSQEKEGHEDKDPIQLGIVFLISVIGMDDVIGKVGIGIAVALLACF